MRYSDGKEVKVGDKVQLWNGCTGVVVCSIDADEYSADYPKEDWSYLKTGVMIKTDKSGLLHYLEADEDFLLLARA